MGPSDITRFWSKVDHTNECWEWTASRKRSGYGQFQVAGRPFAAHRVAWEITNGPIPPGMVVRHKCDNPPCVRPDHLELGTIGENVQDMMTRGRFVPISHRRRDSVDPTDWAETQEEDEFVDLAHAAVEMGLAAGTLRWQIRNRKLRAEKFGSTWVITRRELERYRKEHKR